MKPKGFQSWRKLLNSKLTLNFLNYEKRHLLLFFVICSTLIFKSCKKINPGSNTPDKTKVILPNGFLGVHGKFHNGTKRINYVISVDSYRGNGQFEVNYKTFHFNRSNDDSVTDNITFEIQVPKDGTFVVSITAQSEGCMKFANGSSCPANYGRVFYRGLTPQYNANKAPTSIFITPKLANQF